MVDTRARFLKPTKFGDDVMIETKVTEFRRSSFDVQHRLTLQRRTVRSNASTPGSGPRAIRTIPEKIKAKPIPQEVIAKFAAVTRGDPLMPDAPNPSR